MNEREAWHRVSFLDRKVRAVLPPSHPVHHAFAAFRRHEDQLSDNVAPTRGVLERVMNAWRSLSIEERLRIMQGWAITDEYPTATECQTGWGCMVFRYAYLTADDDSQFAAPTFDTDDTPPAPVRVMIVEGTAKESALQCLRKITRMVEERWADLVAGVTVYENEKSGTPAEPFISLPGSCEDERAECLTPA